MKILWLTWKDKEHPLAGGAEVVSSELCKRLAADGHEVLLITGGFTNAAKELDIDGYKVVRLGNRFTLYWQAYRYVRKHLAGWPELVIEEVNTIPFLSRFYLKNVKRYLFIHQLARQIWFYEMVFPLSLVGYLLEPLYLRLLSIDPVITVSNSTKQDLLKYGFDAQKISIISEGILIEPVKSLSSIKKFAKPTMVSLGALRAMKRTLDQVKAFEIAKTSIPNLRLKIAGDTSGKYGQKVLTYIINSPSRDDIEVLGRISTKQKQELLQKSHVIAVTSIKEGWGLIVTEAASQGTPAVVYNVDGLRDSVRNNKTGLICDTNTPKNLAARIEKFFSSQDTYDALQKSAWKWSKSINFETSYKDFERLVA